MPAVSKRWILAPEEPLAEHRLREELGITPQTARVLTARGLHEPAAVKRFLQPRLADLPQPNTLLNAEVAARRIADALERGESIAIHGDYDADGVTASAVLLEFFEAVGHRADLHLPKRMDQGYGFAPESAKELIERGHKLLITVDCGVNDHEAVRLARDHGVDVIVTDHHEIAGELPPALAVVNPHQPTCGLHDEALAGVGVAFFLVAAVRQELIRRGHAAAGAFELKSLLDLVALGTVADVVPLLGVNRILVFHGLKLIDEDRRPGFTALKKVALVASPVRCGDLSFRLAPRINAAGRLGDATIGVHLLRTRDAHEAARLAKQLHEENAKRQAIEGAIFQQAQKMFESIPRRERLLSIVLTHPQWHQGVIGIVASRLVEVFHRPTILIGAGDPVWRGSGRSIPGFNLYEGLKACADYLDGFGGHAQAAGLQIRPDRIADFAKAFDQHARSVLKPEDLVPQQRIDAWCDIESVNERLVRELAALVPFGFGNPEPVFAARDVRVVNKQVVGGDHLKLRVPWGKVVMAVIAYGQAGLFDQIGGRIDLAYTPEFSYFGGAEHIQLRAKDIIVPDR